MRRIRGAGSNGIAGTLWDVEYPRKINAKSSDGDLSKDMFLLFKKTAIPWIWTAEKNNDKLSCIGRMIVGKYKVNSVEI